MTDEIQRPYGVDSDFDTEDSNRSSNPVFADILAKALSRRAVLGAGVGAAVTATLAGSVVEAAINPALESDFEKGLAAKRIPFPLPARPGFTAVPVGRADAVVVPAGYNVQVIHRWGDPITGSYPAYRDGGLNTAEEQAQQVGQNTDGMHWFPIYEQDPNQRGLLVVNHEYIDQPKLHPNGATTVNGSRPAEEVRKEINAHGVSIAEYARGADGQWALVRGPLNRRITGATPMEITGPVRGHPKVVTKYSPSGTMTRGTLNNCAHGYTPWGTYLTCEENWAGYFVNRDPAASRPREHTRYGVPSSASRYGWDTAGASPADEFVRFNCSATGASAAADYRNEVNGQGWVVEIDPYNPNSVPKKRTAMGRFAHEGAFFAPPRVGEPLAYYMGDDSQNEYVYKFVTAGIYNPFSPDRDMLERGTLYVAIFNPDGSGRWAALDINDEAFRDAARRANVTFTDQGDVLLNTRLAADVVGATRMDRPEWGWANPRNGVAYMTMTNNSARTAAQVNPANPRGPNPFGHIIRWREDGDRPGATTFRWDIFCLSGTEADSAIITANGTRSLTAENIHASPDGLWFDDAGGLWIQTDMSGSQLASGPFGHNAMLLADPVTGNMKRFLVGPVGQEVTGVVTTPNLRTMFVGIQHPGETGTSRWPDGGSTRARSAICVVTKADGGVIGT